MFRVVRTASILTEAASLCLVSRAQRIGRCETVPSVVIIAVNVQDFLALHTQHTIQLVRTLDSSFPLIPAYPESTHSVRPARC
jgi:hypothetical protein